MTTPLTLTAAEVKQLLIYVDYYDLNMTYAQYERHQRIKQFVGQLKGEPS